MKSLLLLILAFAGLIQVEKVPADTGVLSGKVLADDGQPMAGATVMAYSPNADNPVSRTVAADEEGNFKFVKLPLGNYQLLATRQGYVFQDVATSSPRLYRTGENALLTLTRGGVITGRVMSSAGEPVVEIGVNALRVGSIDGRRRPAGEPQSYSMQTDDRGQYRIFGLPPGKYLIRANVAMYFMREGDPHLGEKTIYYPSNGIEAAQEVTVNPGEVVTGIDIRYRGEQGLRIGGRITGADALKSGNGALYVNLFSLPGKSKVAFTNTYGSPFESFSLSGISDGQYLIEAFANVGPYGSGDVYRTSRRLTVRGSDISNISLRLVPYANVEARVTISRLGAEEFAKLKLRRTELPEIRFELKPETAISEDDQEVTFDRNKSACDSTGRLAYRGLPPTTYRLIPQFPGPELYLKSIAVGAKTASGKATALDIGKTGLKLLPGDRQKGIEITLAEGAASLEGVVKRSARAATGGRYVVFLLPVEPEARENFLRYYEIVVAEGAGFSLGNIEPGRYRVFERELTPEELKQEKTPRAWDARMNSGVSPLEINLATGENRKLGEMR